LDNGDRDRDEEDRLGLAPHKEDLDGERRTDVRTRREVGRLDFEILDGFALPDEEV
jgi:hypothetical protein